MDETKPVRRRGRPRKSETLKNQEKKQTVSKKKKDEEEEIILQLKVFTDDVPSGSSDNSDIDDEDNLFTLNETTDNPKKVPYLTEKGYSDDSSESLSVEKLYQELKSKEKLIEQLTKKVNNLNTYGSYTATAGTKDVIRKLKNMNLIDINGNKVTVKENTNIKCWHCTHNFDTPPCFLPDRYVNGVFHVFGCFCSLNCAATYNQKQLNDSRVKSRYSLLNIMAHKIYGPKYQLTYAPPKEVLVDYGGDKTIKDFRDSFLTISKEYHLNIPPMIPLLYEFETKYKDNVETIVSSAM
jgi:hypothetical protein